MNKDKPGLRKVGIILKVGSSKQVLFKQLYFIPGIMPTIWLERQMEILLNLKVSRIYSGFKCCIYHEYYLCDLEQFI